jgi:butyrate kinase
VIPSPIFEGRKTMSISTARVAIEELKKSATPTDQHHWEAISSTLESIGQRLNKLEKAGRSKTEEVIPASMDDRP